MQRAWAVGWTLALIREMAKTRKYSWRHSNPDFRRRIHPPLPPVEEIQRRQIALIRPEHFTPLRLVRDKGRLRDRVLTLPVMVAVVLSLIWRQVASLREVVRIVEDEGLLWLEPFPISRQAVSQRLQSLPAGLLAKLLHEVIARLADERVEAAWQRRPTSRLEKALSGRFPAVFIADGSTLDRLQRRCQQVQDGVTSLAGKMMMIVQAWSRLPVRAWYREDPQARVT